MKSIVLLKCLVALCLSLFLSASVLAQGIQIYVAAAAGGPLDQVARKLATRLSTHTTVIVTNTSYNDPSEAINGLSVNSDWNLVIAETFVSDASELEMQRLRQFNSLAKVAYLYERTLPPHTVGNPVRVPRRLVAGIYAHPNVLPMWSDRVQQSVKALGAEGFDYTFGVRNVVAFNQSASALTVANLQLSQTQPPAPNTPVNAPPNTTIVSTPASMNADDAIQAGHSDAPLSIAATGKIDIFASLNTERTRYAPAQMPQGLSPTNLNVYNDLPTTMMGVPVANLMSRSENAQTAVDQDRRGNAKRHSPLAEAHQCLKLIKQPRMYGGLTNTCNYAVEFNFCLYHPEVDSWGAMFDCEKGNGSGGSWQVGPLKNVAAHTNGAERVHWFACRWGETLGKPDGVSPADVHFDRGSRRMMGRCSTWGRESERYASAPTTASASQQMQASAQRPAGAAQQSNTSPSSANAPTSTASTQANTSSSSSSSAGTGKWPAGVEPGNLYIVKYRITTEDTTDQILLVSARSKTEAGEYYERAHKARRDFMFDYYKRNMGVVDRATKAVQHYKLNYQITQECLGANWGAVVNVNPDGRTLYTGAVCGASTPAEAIKAAFESCSKSGFNCNREGTKDSSPRLVIGHSGSKPWINGGGSIGGSGIHSSFGFMALSASTVQPDASYQDYIMGPNEAVASFGKACGKKVHARDIYSCWITSRNIDCINKSPINPQDKMPMQQTCVDMKLSKDGYLP